MDIATFVERLPLNTYERAAIVFLSSVENATATLVVKHALIPQGRIYSVLNSLKHKGIVEIVPSSPKRYLIKDIHSALHGYLERERLALEQQQSVLQHLDVHKQVTALSPASTVSYTGRDAHLEALAMMKNAARKEILQIAPLFVGSFASNLTLQRALERGVHVKIIIRGVTKENRKAVEQAVKNGAQLRMTKSIDPLSLFIRDGEEVLFGVEDYRKDEERLTIRTSNKALLTAFGNHFQKEWKSAKLVRL